MLGNIMNALHVLILSKFQDVIINTIYTATADKERFNSLGEIQLQAS